MCSSQSCSLSCSLTLLLCCLFVVCCSLFHPFTSTLLLSFLCSDNFVLNPALSLTFFDSSALTLFLSVLLPQCPSCFLHISMYFGFYLIFSVLFLLLWFFFVFFFLGGVFSLTHKFASTLLLSVLLPHFFFLPLSFSLSLFIGTHSLSQSLSPYCSFALLLLLSILLSHLVNLSPLFPLSCCPSFVLIVLLSVLFFLCTYFRIVVFFCLLFLLFNVFLFFVWGGFSLNIFSFFFFSHLL